MVIANCDFNKDTRSIPGSGVVGPGAYEVSEGLVGEIKYETIFFTDAIGVDIVKDGTRAGAYVFIVNAVTAGVHVGYDAPTAGLGHVIMRTIV